MLEDEDINFIFTWRIKSVQKWQQSVRTLQNKPSYMIVDKFVVQVEFSEPLYISTGNLEVDVIEVEVMPEMFDDDIDEQGFYKVEDYLVDYDGVEHKGTDSKDIRIKIPR